MNRSESFPIDIADRADIKAKLPRAREILIRRNRVLQEALDDVDSWKTLVELMEHIVGAGSESTENDADEPPSPEKTDELLPPQDSPGTSPLMVDFSGVETLLDAAVRTVNEQSRAIRSREVAELLRREPQFASVQNDAVSNSLYYAAERADPPRVRKLQQRGVYAPLEPVAMAARPESVAIR